jgi:predicted ATPase
MSLKTIKLKNFKSFENLELELSGLNILAGANSVGKSTVIQSLLLMKQNKNNIRSTPPFNGNDEGFELDRFDVNGELVSLGNEDGLIYIDAQDDEIGLAISGDKFSLLLSKETKGAWQVLTRKSDMKKRETDWISRSFMMHRETVPDFSYLSTNRAPPLIIYPLSDYNIANHSIGIYGQFTAHYLAVNKASPLTIKALKHPGSRTDLLLENVSHWLAQISENVDVTAKVLPEANQAAITYSYSYGNKKSREITPLNVGFGVTHVLPVVTLLLMAKPGETIIIENPEAHLHPKGQANLAKLISLVAAHGVQVIIETHSDHILNGVRVATKEGIIKPEQSKVFFFQHKQDSLACMATEITIEADGSVNQWPKGFFDEWDNQLDKLLW